MGIHHTRITILGTAGTGIENWSTSFATAYESGSSASDMEADALLAAGLFASNFWNPSVAELPPSTAFTGCRAQLISADGHVEATGEYINSIPNVGTAGTVSLPLECALVCSLRTSTPGPRGRGRMYLPAPAVANVIANGVVDDALVGQWVDRMRDFFDAWNATPGVFRAGVCSNVGVEVSSVTSIRIGNVVDSQRRRRNRQPERYQGLVLAP